jgi:uncharacterized protein (DUF1778 family)
MNHIASSEPQAADQATQRLIESFRVHPLDYGLIEKAAKLQTQSITDFVLLAAYSTARDFLALQKELQVSNPSRDAAAPQHRNRSSDLHENN